jgi:phage shock protein A
MVSFKPIYSEIDLIKSLTNFSDAIQKEIHDAEETHTFLPGKIKELGERIEHAKTAMTEVHEKKERMENRDWSHRTEDTLNYRLIINDIFITRESTKELFKESVKENSDLEGKLKHLYKDAQKKLKWYSEFMQQVDLETTKGRISKVANEVARGIPSSTFYSRVSQMESQIEAIEEQTHREPYSYGGKRQFDEENIHRQLTETSSDTDVLAKKEFPSRMPTLKKLPRIRDKSPAVIERTTVMCESLKEIIKWKYHKLAKDSLDPERSEKSYLRNSELARLRHMFAEIQQFQTFISRNPKRTYVSEAKDLSKKLNEFYIQNFSNSEKYRAAEFFRAANKELKQFHNTFK